MLNLVELLTPHMSRVHFFEIDAPEPNSALVPMYFCWLNNGIVSSANTLSIRSNAHLGPLHIVAGTDFLKSSSELLRSVRTLHLESTRGSRKDPAYDGLVDLRLSFPKGPSLS